MWVRTTLMPIICEMAETSWNRSKTWCLYTKGSYLCSDAEIERFHTFPIIIPCSSSISLLPLRASLPSSKTAALEYRTCGRQISLDALVESWH